MHLPKLLAERAEAAGDKAELFDFYHNNFDELFEFARDQKLALAESEQEVSDLKAEIESSKRADARIVQAVRTLIAGIKE